MKKSFLVLAILGSIALFMSCTGSQEKVIDQYFEAFNKENYSDMKPLFHSKIDDEMVDFSKTIRKDVGEVKSHSKYAFNTSTNNGETQTQLFYECTVSETTKNVYFLFSLRTEGESDKISSILYSTNKEYVDNYNDYKEDVLNTMDEFYDASIKKDETKMAKFFDEEIANDDEMTKMFFDFMYSKEEYYGVLKEYSFEFINSELIDNVPYFYVFYSCKSDEGTSFVEAYTLRKSDNGFKIYDFHYAKSIDELIE